MLVHAAKQQLACQPLSSAYCCVLLLSVCSDAQAELLTMQGAKQDLELGQAILIDKLQQCKAENEQMVQQIEKLKARISNSTADYVSTVLRLASVCTLENPSSIQAECYPRQLPTASSGGWCSCCLAVAVRPDFVAVQVDILQHRGEQIKAADARATSLQQQLDHYQQELTQAAKEVAALKVTHVDCTVACIVGAGR